MTFVKFTLDKNIAKISMLNPFSMAVSSSSSLLNSLSSLSLSSSSPPQPPPPITVSLSSASSSCNAGSSKTLEIRQTPITPAIRELCPEIQSVLFPSVAFSNTLYFKSHYNAQVFVGNADPDDMSFIGLFRREVFKANVIQECKRRRFFETNQEKRKRKVRDAARRRSRARRQSRPMAKKEEVPRKEVVDDDEDKRAIVNEKQHPLIWLGFAL